jgi:hypothetical protein
VNYYLSFGKYESNLKKPGEFLIDIFPSTRQHLLANIEDLVNTVIQNSDEIEENLEVYENEDNSELNDKVIELSHFDELEISVLESEEDNADKDSSFELVDNYNWNPSDPYDFLNEMSEEYRNYLL